jgi:hypothetical protein
MRKFGKTYKPYSCISNADSFKKDETDCCLTQKIKLLPVLIKTVVIKAD